jgi:hypothetical protein
MDLFQTTSNLETGGESNCRGPPARTRSLQVSKLSIQSALITAVAIAGFAVGRSWPAGPADDRAYYVKAIESSLAACLENLKAKEGER